MEVHVISEKANWKAFPLIFLLVLFFLIFFGGLLSFLFAGRFLPTIMLFNQMLFLSVAVAVGLAFANRLKTLAFNVREEEAEYLTASALRRIQEMGFTEERRGDTYIFRHRRRIHRLFADWRHTERIILRKTETGILASGPARFVNDLPWLIQEDLKRNATTNV